MSDRKYRIVVARDQGGLERAARGWTILISTIRPFISLETNDDQRLGNIGSVDVNVPGMVALAYKD